MPVHKKLYDKTKRVFISQIPYEHSIWSEWRDLPACGQSGGAVEQPTGLFSVPRPSSPASKEKTTLAASFLWSEWRDLNPRPLPPQGSALPPEPHPDYPTANIIAFARGFVKSFLKKIQFIFQGITFFGLFTIFYRLFSKNV